MQKTLILIICIALPVATGFLSGFLTGNASKGDWYQSLAKPVFNPPSYVFGPIWTILYILMGISLYLIYRAPESPERQWALAIFVTQLFLNFCWSLIFFRLQQVGLAAVEIVAILAAIITMVFTFYKIAPLAAALQLPYLAWVSFATILNITIYYLNRPT